MVRALDVCRERLDIGDRISVLVKFMKQVGRKRLIRFAVSQNGEDMVAVMGL